MKGRGWYSLIAGFVIMMAMGTVYSWSVFRPYVETQLSIGSALSGFPYMTSLAFFALFMMLTGRVLDRYQPKQLLTLAGLLLGIGYIGSSFATNVWALTLFYGGCIGSAVGIAYGVPIKVVGMWFASKRGLMVGWVLLGFGMSPLVSAPLASRLLQQVGLSQSLLILGVMFALLLIVLGQFFQYPYPIATTSVKQDSLASLLSQSRFVGLYITFLIGTLIGLTIIGLSTNIGIEYASIPANQMALYISVFAIFNGLGRPLFGGLVDRLGVKNAMYISYGMIFFSSILMVVWAKPAVFVIATVIYWLNLGGWLAIAPAATSKLFSNEKYSRNFGVVFTAYGVGALIGVSSSGLILDLLSSYKLLFLSIATLSILGTFLVKKLIHF